MHLKSHRASGFTLIELLTVIAIIAVLAAILFPTAGTVREQARASDCLSKLHQLYVSARVYHEDEGAYPPSLMGIAEHGLIDLNGNCHPEISTGLPFGTQPNTCLASADRIINGYLFSEQIRDSRVFYCPDDIPPNKNQIALAHFPPRPPSWPIRPDGTAHSYVTDPGTAVYNTCPTDNGEPVACFLDGPYQGMPMYFYTFDSYDVSPRILPNGQVAKDPAGNKVYELHYATDWTGITGANDLPVQLKYSNPASDKTLLTYCTWHTTSSNVPTFTAVSLSGKAQKIDYKTMLGYGHNVLNK